MFSDNIQHLHPYSDYHLEIRAIKNDDIVATKKVSQISTKEIKIAQ